VHPVRTRPTARAASDCIDRKRAQASRRDEDHRLSHSHCHKLGSADAADAIAFARRAQDCVIELATLLRSPKNGTRADQAAWR
jgi:hypothetical protein